MQVILITGLSGSGKSIALNVLEDNGYYCVDNLPVEMLPQLIELLQEEGNALVAVSIDARSGETLNQLPQQINALKHQGIDLRAMFLEANTETLVKRYSETRRRHPLSDGERTISESIETERELLGKIAEIGHRMDTSDLSPNALRGWVKDFLGLDRSRITLLFESFGFKHGLPLDADFVFDVRCLPNPFYDPKLRPFTGKDQPVVDFIESQDDAIAMLADIRYYVEKWLPCFIRDNRAYLTVAIGCTGGQHRSVYFAEQLAERFRSEYQVLVRHRGLSA
ncbi:MAG: RNase adapter RapZ [Hydrogenophilales bacterium]|nr:RNase adapter RapZ [Hydrogenophilales bacterium]